MTECRLLKQHPPWKVVRGFARQDGGSLVHLGNVSGGVFGGDRLRLRARLESGAEAMMTTTGATRIYRPRVAAPEAVLECEVELGADALLDFLPDPLIPFRGARLVQKAVFSLEAGAVLLSWEVIAPGRAAAGEVFAFERMKIATEIQVCGRPVLDDRLLFEPRHFPLSAAGSMGRYKYLVTFVAMRAGAASAETKRLEEKMAELGAQAESVAGVSDELWASTELPAHGVLVRGALRSPLRIPHRLQSLWCAARQEICGRTVALPRKTY